MTSRKVELVLETLFTDAELICRSHDTLGIPLEDCICAVVRKTLRNLDVNPEQMELFGEEFEQKAVRQGPDLTTKGAKRGGRG